MCTGLNGTQTRSLTAGNVTSQADALEQRLREAEFTAITRARNATEKARLERVLPSATRSQKGRTAPLAKRCLAAVIAESQAKAVRHSKPSRLFARMIAATLLHRGKGILAREG